MRNPLNSWDKSDSEFAQYVEGSSIIEICHEKLLRIGFDDFALMKRLAAAGNDHGKFMRMINVTCDIVAPLYWWKEFDTYKVGTVANSCSTMHKIADKEFKNSDFSCEHLIDGYDNGTFMEVIQSLNHWRKYYLKTNDKKYWWQMIQLLPCSYNQRRTIQLNYAVLKNIYHARKNHKLDEWHDFCYWIEELPYSELITGEKENERE